jgi:hypothetical protein
MDSSWGTLEYRAGGKEDETPLIPFVPFAPFAPLGWSCTAAMMGEESCEAHRAPFANWKREGKINIKRAFRTREELGRYPYAEAALSVAVK